MSLKNLKFELVHELVHGLVQLVHGLVQLDMVWYTN